MANDRITLGNVEIVALSDGYIDFMPETFFPSVPIEAWQAYRDQLSPEGRMHLNIGSFLVRTEETTVLIDTGLGPSISGLQDAVGGLLLTDFESKGISVDDVDVVAITHLHMDHVGWNLISHNGSTSPTFPNARYWIPQADWDIYSRRTIASLAYIQEQVIPLESLGVLVLMAGEQTISLRRGPLRMDESIIAIPTPGHTPGHTSFIVRSQGEEAILVGDAIHLPLQIQEPDWSPRADANADISRRTRRRLLDRIEQDAALLVSGHFPAPGYGKLIRVEGRRYWKGIA